MRQLFLCSTAILCLLAVSLGTGRSEDKKRPVPAMKEWEQDVRKIMDKSEKLKKLAAKYPLVVLHARYPYAGGQYKQSAFSFIYETTDWKKHLNDVQIVFGNGGEKDSFHTNMLTSQKNLIVDLGKQDFGRDPDPAQINIDHPGLGEFGIAVAGHVYLERVRDSVGNNFYVVFEIVALDADGRYMAFIWRKLPGGKTVKRVEQK